MRKEIEKFNMEMRNIHLEKEIQVRKNKRDTMENAKTVMNLVTLDNTEIYDNEVLDAKAERKEGIWVLQKELNRLETEYQLERKRIAALLDKHEKVILLERAKKKRNENVLPVKERLEELKNTHLVQKTSSVLGNLQPIPLSRESLLQVKNYRGGRLERKDPKSADLEIGKIYFEHNMLRKAEASYLKAVGTCKPDSNSRTTASIQKQKARERSTYMALYELYIKRAAPQQAARAMQKWLSLGSAQQRQQDLQLIEEVLARYEYLCDEDTTSSEKVLDNVYKYGKLGSLSDLRFTILQELNTITPRDPYILQSLGQLYVRKRDYVKARDILNAYMQCKSVRQLPLWADIIKTQRKNDSDIEVKYASLNK